ncbi:uncharacterized protein M421DRAFT_426305 [Didymella exigua CBS 183.55]|uniref:Uncharacterized protein n=1 Tax=Didymella exigua CBS 183.55 TaxID=1150837 RepID=A0A6A5R4C2_9PLEO|nr:uncharacterized protein M421DRAFT_426305 [Didymella exigua CBS 183.55]KAF1922941.1 hypothetical protein M421DRAFT_426305 [Didymella exigua CBS 183.55]
MSRNCCSYGPFGLSCTSQPPLSRKEKLNRSLLLAGSVYDYGNADSRNKTISGNMQALLARMLSSNCC